MKCKSFKQHITSAASASKQIVELSETFQLIDTHRQRCSVKLMNDLSHKSKSSNKQRFIKNLKYSKNQINSKNKQNTSELKNNFKFAVSGYALDN